MAAEVSATFSLSISPTGGLEIVRRLSSDDENFDYLTNSSGDYESDEDMSPEEEPITHRFYIRLKSRDDRIIDEFSCYKEPVVKDLDDVFELDEPMDEAEDECMLREPSPEPKSPLDGEPDNFKSLQKVLRWLPFKARVNCERVNKSWQRAVREVNLKYQTALGMFGGYVEKIQNFCPMAAHRVHTTDCVELNWYTNFQHVLKKVPNLRSLHIRCDGSPVFRNEGDPESIGRLCPKLEHLSFVDDMCGVNIYDDVMKVFTSCLTIRHLQLRFPYKCK